MGSVSEGSAGGGKFGSDDLADEGACCEEVKDLLAVAVEMEREEDDRLLQGESVCMSEEGALLLSPVGYTSSSNSNMRVK